MAVPLRNKHSLTIYQQSRFEEVFELYEALPNGDPDFDSPINFVVGTVGLAECRKNEDQDSDLITTFTVVIVDNKLTLSLTWEQTKAIKVISGFYDIFITEPDGSPQMFLEGKVTINRAVTIEPSEGP